MDEMEKRVKLERGEPRGGSCELDKLRGPVELGALSCLVRRLGDQARDFALC